MSTKTQADELRHEAKKHLAKMFEIPEGYGNGSVDRIVDCIIGAAILEVAALTGKEINEESRHKANTEIS